MVLSNLDMMVKSILMLMDEHGCKLADGHRLTPDEVISMPDTEIISLFNQCYGRG